MKKEEFDAMKKNSDSLYNSQEIQKPKKKEINFLELFKKLLEKEILALKEGKINFFFIF